MIDPATNNPVITLAEPPPMPTEPAMTIDERSEETEGGDPAGADLAGTVTLWLATPPNQPFRAEIWKLMTDPAARRRGVARALMLAAEQLAAERGRTLLNLDTAAEHGGGPLYDVLGWIRVGEIPNFAYKPLGGMTATIIYYKQLAPPR